MGKSQFSHFVVLGFAITIMSTSGTLGRFIQLPPPAIIWLRCVIGAIVLFVINKALKNNLSIKGKHDFSMFLGGSLLLGIHWVTYFYALQLSSVAVGMLSLFTYPVITAILEPILLKTKFQKSTILLAIISLIGVSFLVPELSFENEYTVGIAFGVFSAVCYSLRNIITKKQIANQTGMSIMFYHLLFIALLGWPMLWIEPFSAAQVQESWKGLLVLGLMTTATGHTLFTLSLKHFTVSTISILSAMTPILGITIGYFVLSEIPEGNTLIGGALVFTTVIGESIISIRRQQPVK